MKKVVLAILCIAILLFVTACSSRHYTKDGTEIYCDFVLVRNISDHSHICYDPETNICYIIVYNEQYHGVAISPYYVIKHGDPVIAVYGKNYE